MKNQPFPMRRSLLGLTLVWLSLVNSGCSNKAEPTSANSGKDGANLAPAKPEPVPIKPEPSREEKLLREQMNIYNQLADHYEKATDEKLMEQEKPAINALNQKLGEVVKELNTFSLEAKQTAIANLKGEWDEAMARYRKNSPMSRKFKSELQSMQSK